ncbi:MAG: AAA family ATPase [Patescibacteria group bacterium]
MKYRNIVVAGDVGTGTTTLAKSLADKLNFKYISAGDFFRKYALENAIPLWDKKSVPDSVDQEIDSKFFEIMKNESGYVFDTHYGGYFARDLADVYRILLICDNKIAEERILKRDHTYLENIPDIRKRRAENLSKFNKLYSPKSPEEREYFHLVSDTTNSTPEKTLNLALSEIEKGLPQR